MDGHKKQKLYQEKDILSSLPDCVLTHILFFLPTKDAVSTCVLSSRWRDLWAGLPNIDLDDRLLYFRDMDFGHSYEYVPFMDFVDRILFRQGLSNMTRFRLSCVVCFCPSRISTWISFAIRQNLQELDLRLDLEIPFVLPQCVFSCTSLRVLKIDMECALVVPQMVSLPNLKTLYLALVEFSDEESANKLFGSCPILEELYLLDCEWRVETVTISTPKLRRLRIDDHYCCGLLHESSDCIIEVEAPNLISFKYNGNLSNEIFLKKSPLLAMASIVVYIEPAERIFDMSSRVAELINGLQNVQILVMSNDAIQSLLVAEKFFGWHPVFQKLTYMEVFMENDNDCLEAMLELLQSLPHLEVLALPMVIYAVPSRDWTLICISIREEGTKNVAIQLQADV